MVTNTNDRVAARMLHKNPRKGFPSVCTSAAGEKESRLRPPIGVGERQQIIDHLSAFDLSALHPRQPARPGHDGTLRSVPAAAKTTPISPATAPNSTA